MKRLMIALALFLGVQAVSNAQEVHDRKGQHRNMTPEQRAEKQTERMQQDLQLTDAQKKAVYELNLQSAKEMKAARTEGAEANKEKFKAMHEQRDARLNAILSADQLKKYETIKAERKNKMKERRADKGLRQG